MSVPSPRFAAVYIRVSTDEQTELSPESQLEKLREYAAREGLLILPEHIYIDAGISGKRAQKRPAFLQMIAAAKEKDCPFSVLLLWKFSRFARNQEESIFYKSILRSKCGVEVVSITEPLLAGHFGSLIERIIEWMDEFYSIRLSEEVKRSMEVNARRGKLQSTPSFGYAAQDGHLVVLPQEAETVRMIFSRFLAGAGLYTIARELNAMGVRTHRGNLFENRTVEYILRNPVYIGKLRWNPSGRTRRDFHNEHLIIADAEHEPLISMETWDATQQRLDEVKAQWRYKGKPAATRTHWLIGSVRCARCGASLVRGGEGYVRCNNYAHGRCLHSQFIKTEILAAALLERLQGDADRANDLSYDVSYLSRSGAQEVSQLETGIRNLQTRLARLQEAYLSGVIELAEFSETKKALAAQQQRLREELDALHRRDDRSEAQRRLQEAIRSVLSVLRSPDATMEQKSTALQSLVSRCDFDKATSTLAVTYRVTL